MELDAVGDFRRDSFVFYRSFFEAIKNLKPKDQSLLFCAVCEFALNGEEIELSGVNKTIFTLIKPQIEANTKRYLNGQKGKEFGKLGGAPKGNQNAKKQPQNNPETSPNVNDNVNVNVNDNENVNVNELEVDSHPLSSPSLSTGEEFTYQDRQKFFFEFYDLYPKKDFKDQALNYWCNVQKYDKNSCDKIVACASWHKRHETDENKLKSPYYYLVDETWKTDLKKVIEEKRDKLSNNYFLTNIYQKDEDTPEDLKKEISDLKKEIEELTKN